MDTTRAAGTGARGRSSAALALRIGQPPVPVPAPTCISCEDAPATVRHHGYDVCAGCAMAETFGPAIVMVRVGRWSTWAERDGDIA